MPNCFIPLPAPRHKLPTYPHHFEPASSGTTPVPAGLAPQSVRYSLGTMGRTAAS